MQHLFQSTFLQALGYAIANSLWQTALVWLIYMSITGLISISAASKYRLAVSAQVTGFVWFIITFQFYYRQYSDAWQHSAAVPQNIQSILSSNTDLSSRLINWMVRGEQLLPYVSMAYLLLMLFLCIRWFLGYRQTQLIRNHGLQKMPAEWRLFVNRIAGQLNIKKKIQVFLSGTVTTPLTIGFLKPVILIPIASINHLTTDQLEAVLLHELAHIKRYDYLANIILSVVEISLFFNPFTQLLSKSIRKERENSCDDWVLQFQYDASLYAEALLRIAYLQATPAFAMAATGKKNELLVRVKRMIEKKENRFSYRRQLLAFVIVTGILSSIAWLNPLTPHAEKQNTASATNKTLQKKVQGYAVEPMAVSVDNPLFNPVFFLSEPLKAKMKKNIASAQKEIDAAALEYIKEPIPPVESLTPLVAGALEQASRMLSSQNPAWEKSMAKMDVAKVEFEKAFHNDSLFGPRIKQLFKEELGNSMKKVQADINNAKTEMQRSFKMCDDIAADKEKMQPDQLGMQKAMEALEQLDKMGLDKLVLGSFLKIPGLINKDSKPRHHIKLPALPPPANTKMRTRMPSADKELLSTQVMPPEEQAEDIDLATIIKIKDFLLLQAAAVNKKIRIVPVAYKEKRAEDEQKIVIQLQ